METVFPYLIVYLTGIATPFVILRGVLRDRADDGSGCLLNLVIAAIALLILLCVYFWLSVA